MSPPTYWKVVSQSSKSLQECTNPSTVVQSSTNTTVRRVCNLVDEEGDRGRKACRGIADKETSNSECSLVIGTSLKSCTESKENITNPDRHLATISVGNERRYWIHAASTDPIDGIDETKKGSCRPIKVVVPLIQCLETVHQRAIVSVGGSLRYQKVVQVS